MTDPNHLSPRLVVVAPTYDNARTLHAVLDGVASHGLPIIAVNDGSTDATADLLSAWRDESNGRYVVTHPINRGKAAAMRSGFDRAAEFGFTHALTIDTDGQHDPADVPAMLAAARADPSAIILGHRPMEGSHYPLRSRFGRLLSNGLIWLIGGQLVGDSQCGLRVYPLDVARTLGAKTSRYAFETEVLARAGWAAVKVVQVPVRCIYDVPYGRVTHFRVWRDSMSAAWMHSGLLLRSLWPWPVRKLRPVTDELTTGTILERTIRWMNPRRAVRRLRTHPAERARLAPAVACGLFIGTQPAFGLKTLLCLVAARVFRLQPLVTMGASSLLSPPIAFLVWTGSIAIGNLLLHGTLPSLDRYDFHTHTARQVLGAVAAEWIVGAVLLGAILAAVGWLVARAALAVTGRGRASPLPAATSASR